MIYQGCAGVIPNRPAWVTMFDYIKAGRGFGPVSARDLLRMYQDGVLQPEDPVRQQGQSGWRPAGDVVVGLLRGELPLPDQDDPWGPSRSAGSNTVYTSFPPGPSAVACGACAEPLELNARFCARCGRAAQGWCGGCGAASGPDARFCALCGTPIAR